MTPPPSFQQLMGMLAGVTSKLSGRDGKVIRAHVEQLAKILAAQGPDAELRLRAADELSQLVTAIAELAGAAPGGGAAQAARGIDLTRLADGLRAFAMYLREPTAAHQAEVERLVATLQSGAASVMPPVALDELQIDGRIEELAVESARRHGLSGGELRRAVERMKREMAQLVRQLETRAQQEASRARTAGDAERLVDKVIATNTPLGDAIGAQRAAIVGAFRVVDLLHMAEGLKTFAAWLSKPSEDPVAYVGELQARLAVALGPATAGDPARSEDERRADFEREIKLAIDQIFRGNGMASA